MSFALDGRLEQDSSPVTDLPLSSVRLMRDATYPWLLLVPRRPGLTEIVDLARTDRLALMEEIALCSEALLAEAPCDKLNVAAIGNIVRQLHVHIVARREGDPAWPKPVWGAAPPVPYGPDAERRLIEGVAARLSAPAGTD